MSGSGPTVFGIFPDRQAAARAAECLAGRQQDIQLEVAHTVEEA